MREKPPISGEEPTAEPGKEPAPQAPSGQEGTAEVTEAAVLEVFRALAARGIADPAELDDSDPETIKANELLEAWVINHPDIAQTALVHMVYVHAGFRDPEYLDCVADWLDQDLEGAEASGNVALAEQLKAALAELGKSPKVEAIKESVEDILNRRMAQAKELIGSRDIKNVVQADILLTSAISNPEYRKYFSKNPEEKQKMLQWRDRIRAVQKSVRAGGDISEIDSLLND